MDRSYLWTGSNTHWHCHIYAHVQKCSNKKIQITNTVKKMLKTFTCQKRSLISSHQCDENLTHMPAHIQIVDLKPHEFPGWNLKLTPMYEGQGDTRARGRALQVGGWQFFFVFSSRREISLYIYIYIHTYIFFTWRLLIGDFTIGGGFCHTFIWISHVCTCVISKRTYI